LLGAINMQKMSRHIEIPILQASTSEIYGDPLVHPQTEEYWGNVNPVGIRSCYDEGKRCAETLFFDYHRQYGVAIKVMRIFNTYGPRMAPDDGRVISNFICQALRGDPLSIFGDGSHTRSFCYVSDLVEAMVRFMASPKEVTGPLNVGNPQETTIAELSHKILALSESASAVDYFPLPADDPRQRQPNIDRARQTLGWQPTVTIEDGLTQTVAYFRSGGF
jgi:UDP-glucuronate decarboxylase